ncbi:hypothetical protein [Paucibacter sp. B51]|uniref:hypothetical protein n=1 Tax=Paucibacter sp. B51 TaxID=2993315 RepID=UPI0022EBECDA|nr:hypothetical protein [Paucibacter sp. B51]
MSKNKKQATVSRMVAVCLGLSATLGMMAPAWGQISSQGTVIQTPQPVAPAVVGLHQLEDAAKAPPVEAAAKAGKASGRAASKAANKKTSKAAAKAAPAKKAKASKSAKPASKSGKKAAAEGVGKSSKSGKKAQQASGKRKAH